MRRFPTLHAKGEPAVLPDRAINRQSHYFIYRPLMSSMYMYIYIYIMQHTNKHTSVKCVLAYIAIQLHVSVASVIIDRVSQESTSCLRINAQKIVTQTTWHYT